MLNTLLDTARLRVAPTHALQDELWELVCFDYLNDPAHARRMVTITTELLRRGKLPVWANTERTHD